MLSKWKHIPFSWIKRPIIVKQTILYKTIYRFNPIPIIMPLECFCKIEKSIPNSTWVLKRPYRAKIGLGKNKAKRLLLIDFKFYHKTSLLLAQRQTNTPIEQKSQKSTNAYMLKWFLITVARLFKRERIFSAHNARKTGYPHTKE